MQGYNQKCYKQASNQKLQMLGSMVNPLPTRAEVSVSQNACLMVQCSDAFGNRSRTLSAGSREYDIKIIEIERIPVR